MSLAIFKNEPPFIDFLGIEIVSRGENEVVGRLPFRPELQNRKGDVHGGAIASLLDTVLGAAARAGLETGSVSTTLSLTVNYVSPGRGDLRCTARCTKKGRSIRFLQGEVLDGDNELVATAVATFKVFRAKTT